MIGYVGVQEQVDKDFHRALLKASLHRWKDRLRRDLADEHLLSFDEAKGALAQWNQVYRGMRVVEVEKITGSVGRYKDLELPSIGWQLFILGSSQSDSTAFPSSLDTYATRLLTEPLRQRAGIFIGIPALPWSAGPTETEGGGSPSRPVCY